jgi:hypothetical protein
MTSALDLTSYLDMSAHLNVEPSSLFYSDRAVEKRMITREIVYVALMLALAPVIGESRGLESSLSSELVF